ncbi:MAG: hypothetical protein ACOH14_04195 [Rhodoglobus sp.]
MSEKDPEPTFDSATDDEARIPWLTIAIVTQTVAVMWSLVPGSASGASLVAASIFNLGLLLLLKRGQTWASKAFLTLSIWGLIIRALGVFVMRYLPNDDFQIDWANMCLTVIAIYAVLKVPPRPQPSPAAK